MNIEQGIQPTGREFEENIAEEARKILRSEPNIQLTRSNKGLDLYIGLPGNCGVEGTIDTAKQAAEIDQFNTQQYSGHGIGSRLIRLFAAECVDKGVFLLKGQLVSEAAIRTRLKVFGVDRTTFYKSNDPDKKTLTPEEAIELIHTIRQAIEDGDPDYEDNYLIVLTDLNGLSSEELRKEQL